MTYEDGDIAVLNIESLVSRAVHFHTHTRVLALAKTLKTHNAALFEDVNDDVIVETGMTDIVEAIAVVYILEDVKVVDKKTDAEMVNLYTLLCCLT